MRFDIVTLFPEMVGTAAGFGVIGRAIENGIVRLGLWNPRDYSSDPRRTVDDRPYGGGPGMVMMVQPLRDAINDAKAADDRPVRVACLSPQGTRLQQSDLIRFSTRERVILVAGRYEGIDERLIEADIDEQWSLGDYVISGGELAALVFLDGVARLLPGVLGDDQSSQQDSFMHGLLDHPHYTRPDVVEEQVVPEVLRNGNHAEIRRWRLKQALGRTFLHRPDLLDDLELNDEQNDLLNEFIDEVKIMKGN